MNATRVTTDTEWTTRMSHLTNNDIGEERWSCSGRWILERNAVGRQHKSSKTIVDPDLPEIQIHEFRPVMKFKEWDTVRVAISRSEEDTLKEQESELVFHLNQIEWRDQWRNVTAPLSSTLSVRASDDMSRRTIICTVKASSVTTILEQMTAIISETARNMISVTHCVRQE